jgi:hypothetical protein
MYSYIQPRFDLAKSAAGIHLKIPCSANSRVNPSCRDWTNGQQSVYGSQYSCSWLLTCYHLPSRLHAICKIANRLIIQVGFQLQGRPGYSLSCEPFFGRPPAATIHIAMRSSTPYSDHDSVFPMQRDMKKRGGSPSSPYPVSLACIVLEVVVLEQLRVVWQAAQETRNATEPRATT